MSRFLNNLCGGEGPGPARRQRGLSLVELLVAMGLGAFITVGIIQMFTANQETYRVNVGQSRMQESARFAMEFLTSPVRMAGYAGCFSDEQDMHVALATPLPFQANFQAGVIGGPITDLPDPPGPNDINRSGITSGTDVLYIRLGDPKGARLVQPMADASALVVVREPDNASAYATGALLLISDCEKGALFQSTNSTTASGRITITHATGSTGVLPGNSVANLSADNAPYDVGASVHAVETYIFYIAPGGGSNNRDVQPLALWRKAGGQPPAQLVEGVENLQVAYGVDTDQDAVPNIYKSSPSPLERANAVTVRIEITVNSVDVTDSDVDQSAIDIDGDNVTDRGAPGLLRRTFTNTVALRNRVRAG